MDFRKGIISQISVTVAAAKQSASVNLNGLQNCIQINKKTLSGIANYEKNKTEIDCWEADHNFSWDRKKSVDRENNLIPRKIKETIHVLKNPNHINKIFYMVSGNDSLN